MNTKKILRCFLLLQFGYVVSFAQIPCFQWVNPKSTLRERIELNSFIRAKEDSLGNWVDQGFVKSTLNFSDDKQIVLEKINHFNLNNGEKVWFTNNGSQRVFSYSLADNTFKRIDKSTYAGYNFNATQFIRKDTLYSAGGYGFWHYSNVLTYFVESKGEWEIIRTDGSAPKTILGGYQGYDAHKDILYSGASEEETLGRHVEKGFGDKLYKFDFKTYRWVYLGELNSALPYQTQREIFWTGTYFLQWAKDKLFIIDPNANKVYVYEDNKQYFQNNAQYFAKGDTVICYWDRKTNTNKFSVAELLHKSKPIGAFYHESNTGIYVMATVALSLFIGIGYVYRNKIRGLKIQSILQKQELDLLNALLQLEEGAYLNSNELNDLLGLHGKSLESQRKIRMNVINQVKHKIKKRFNISEAIQRIDDPSDKRLKLYYLKQEALKALVRNG
jgi:hypothetical protein